MAKQLKLKSVAEGVESDLDWDTVARLGCDVAQGFFIGRPMPREEIIPWYQAWMGAAPKRTLRSASAGG
jgi:EAL domain-containing protein (putative c-di-GMP-specific phosphodiesterase class I)